MTTETPEQEPTAQEQFAALTQRFRDGEQLSKEDIEFLISLIGGLDVHLRVCNEMLSAALGTTQELLNTTAAAVLRKCGRTDSKIRKKIAAMCQENFETLLTVVQLHGQTIQNKLTNPEEDDNAK